MQLIMLKSKIHRASLTGLQVDYDGSITIDKDLLDKAGILAGEQVHVLNFRNASRMITYTIEAPSGSGTCELNGPAAHLGEIGDEVAILAYCHLGEDAARKHHPVVVHVTSDNRAL